MFEKLKTGARIAADVAYGRAFAETLVPKNRNAISAKITRANGTVEVLPLSYNSRVDAGAAWQAGIMGSGEAQPANYIALSSAVLSPAKSDTTLAFEITTSGLGRAIGTYGNYTAPSALGGAASYTITGTFTATGTQTVNSVALFNAASGGTLFVEANLSVAASLGTGDTVAITWTVNI